MTTILAIYSSILSTLLATPVIIKLIKKTFYPIRFICISATGYLAEENNKTSVKHFFNITIINQMDEILYLSKSEIELRDRGQKVKISHTPFFINNNFENKIESGSSIKEFFICIDDLVADKAKEDYQLFTSFRFMVETSKGKKIKSKWYRQEILINEKTVKWKWLINESDYNLELEGISC